jgi:hypothetical protein
MSAIGGKTDISQAAQESSRFADLAPRCKAAPSHFAQSARAVALTVCPHTQVQVSLSSFTPTFCNVPGPEVIVHLPDTTCSELSVQCASQIMFSSFLGWVVSGPHSN